MPPFLSDLPDVRSPAMGERHGGFTSQESAACAYSARSSSGAEATASGGGSAQSIGAHAALSPFAPLTAQQTTEAAQRGRRRHAPPITLQRTYSPLRLGTDLVQAYRAAHGMLNQSTNLSQLLP
jgi:hypothetical protein